MQRGSDRTVWRPSIGSLLRKISLSVLCDRFFSLDDTEWDKLGEEQNIFQDFHLAQNEEKRRTERD